MQGEHLEMETLKHKVQRIGIDNPITLVLPIGSPVAYGEFLVNTRAFQIDIILGKSGVEPTFVTQIVDAENISTIEMTPTQVRHMAQAAFADLGIVHPGVSDLLNFSQNI